MSPDEPLPEFRVTARLVVGLAIMTAGLVLALDSLGLVDGGVVFRYWPLALVAIGVVKWLSPPRQLNVRDRLDRRRPRLPARHARPDVLRRRVGDAPLLRRRQHRVAGAAAPGAPRRRVRARRGLRHRRRPRRVQDGQRVAPRRNADGVQGRQRDGGHGRVRDRPAPRRRCPTAARRPSTCSRCWVGSRSGSRTTGRSSTAATPFLGGFENKSRPLPGCAEAARRHGNGDHGRRRGQELGHAPDPGRLAAARRVPRRLGAASALLIALQLVLAAPFSWVEALVFAVPLALVLGFDGPGRLLGVPRRAARPARPRPLPRHAAARRGAVVRAVARRRPRLGGRSSTASTSSPACPAGCPRSRRSSSASARPSSS